jgi:tetratricopeptide (TPR) repeat protein
MRRYDEAIQCFNKAIEIEPDNADAWYNKGVALYKWKRNKEAIESFDKSLTIDPNNADAWYYRSCCLSWLIIKVQLVM